MKNAWKGLFLSGTIAGFALFKAGVPLTAIAAGLLLAVVVTYRRESHGVKSTPRT
jgi:hypothetical protein